MTNFQIIIPVRRYDDSNALSEADALLMKKAREAASMAYAPYSGFHVGAAVRLANGAIVTGNNQENAAYPSGLCAERVAVFYASSQYPDVPIEAIAVTARTKVRTISEPVSPCGACRQVLSEYETLHQTPIRIILAGETGPVVEFAKASDLLPMNFTSKDL
ncbi:MAG: cytidine deaminase [Bacteroidales bacterium]|jgi:cytidine deaminase|nr:cytidine deaminase [Bacteroidales bacterium]MDD3664304.1 cytidine deaminase [Bacteroidales bacterium]